MFLYFRVPKKFKNLRGGIKIFRRKFFCLTLPRNFVGEPFSVSLVSDIETVWIRGGVSSNSVENFLSHSAESFRRGTLYCFTVFGYGKSLDRRGGGYHDFPSKIFCRTVPKISLGGIL